MSDIENRGLEHKYHQEAREIWSQQNLKWETEQAFLNHRLLFDMRIQGRARCLSECTPHRGPAIIIGSGSTLNGAIDRLNEWRGGIICSTSHGSTLVHHGCPPTYMCALDPREAPDPELSVPVGGWDQTCYLAHVSTPRAYFQQWFDQSSSIAYLFRILEPTVPWYTNHLKWAYPWVKIGLLPLIDSVASGVTLAARLGYDPIFCLGVDYGGPRFKQDLWMGKEWKEGSASGADQIGPGTMVGPGGISTNAGMAYSKRGLLISSFMRIMDSRKPSRVYQMSKPSNVVEFPYVSFEEVLEKQGQGFPLWTPEYQSEVAEKIEVTLAQSDTYMIPVQGGFGIDYRVYMIDQNMVNRALITLSSEMLENKIDLQTKERERKMSVRAMIESDILFAQMGELAIHEPDDLKYFDVNSMKGVDIETVAGRVRMLYEKSKESFPLLPAE